MLILAAALIAAAPAVADVETRLTGCLSADKGILYHIQEGDAPSRQCDTGDRILTWNITGPAGPQGQVGPAPPHFGFVGVTKAHFNGGAGFLTMTRACASQFPGSRMATVQELRATVNPPDISYAAWILVSPVFWIGPEFIDVSGSSFPGAEYTRDYDCSNWRSASSDTQSSRGAVVYDSGGIYTEGCSVPRAVACSAPE